MVVLFLFLILGVSLIRRLFVEYMQDSKKKEKELNSWEADLRRREQVNWLLNVF